MGDMINQNSNQRPDYARMEQEAQQAYNNALYTSQPNFLTTLPNTVSKVPPMLGRDANLALSAAKRAYLDFGPIPYPQYPGYNDLTFSAPTVDQNQLPSYWNFVSNWFNRANWTPSFYETYMSGEKVMRQHESIVNWGLRGAAYYPSKALSYLASPIMNALGASTTASEVTENILGGIGLGRQGEALSRSLYWGGPAITGESNIAQRATTSTVISQRLLKELPWESEAGIQSNLMSLIRSGSIGGGASSGSDIIKKVKEYSENLRELSKNMGRSVEDTREMVSKIASVSNDIDSTIRSSRLISQWAEEGYGRGSSINAINAQIGLEQAYEGMGLTPGQASYQALGMMGTYDALKQGMFGNQYGFEEAVGVKKVRTAIGLSPYYQEMAIGYGTGDDLTSGQAYARGMIIMARPGGIARAAFLQPAGAETAVEKDLRNIYNYFNDYYKPKTQEDRERVKFLAASSVSQTFARKGISLSLRQAYDQIAGLSETPQIEDIIKKYETSLPWHYEFMNRPEYNPYEGQWEGEPREMIGEHRVLFSTDKNNELFRMSDRERSRFRDIVQKMISGGRTEKEIDVIIKEAQQDAIDYGKNLKVNHFGERFETPSLTFFIDNRYNKLKSPKESFKDISSELDTVVKNISELKSSIDKFSNGEQ